MSILKESYRILLVVGDDEFWSDTFPDSYLTAEDAQRAIDQEFQFGKQNNLSAEDFEIAKFTRLSAGGEPFDSREQFVQTKSVRVLVSRLEDTSLTELNARIGIMLGEVLHKDGKVVAVTQYSHGSDFHGVVYWTNNWAGK